MLPLEKRFLYSLKKTSFMHFMDNFALFDKYVPDVKTLPQHYFPSTFALPYDFFICADGPTLSDWQKNTIPCKQTNHSTNKSTASHSFLCLKQNI